MNINRFVALSLVLGFGCSAPEGGDNNVHDPFDVGGTDSGVAFVSQNDASTGLPTNGDASLPPTTDTNVSATEDGNSWPPSPSDTGGTTADSSPSVDLGSLCNGEPCCDPNTGSASVKGTACGEFAVAFEYQCDGANILERSATFGCDGQSMTICSGDEDNLAWGTWATSDTCAAGMLCNFIAPTVKPTCKAKAQCTSNAECDDGLPCSGDFCDGTQCKNVPVSKGTICGENAITQEFKCNGQMIVQREKIAACNGISSACDGTETAWTAWEVYATCPSGQNCVVANPSKPGICSGGNNQQCTPGTTCCTPQGKYAEAGTKCSDKATTQAYTCSSETELGATITVKKGWDGCTGYSNSCSMLDKYTYWEEPTFHKKCGPLEKCVPWTWADIEPTCENGTDCSPEESCCTASGTYAKAGTKCSQQSSHISYSCSSDTDMGASILIKKGYDGCTGFGTFCSAQSINIYWDPPTLHKKCGALQKCQKSFSDSVEPQCTDATDCNPSDTCCTATGAYAAAGSKCAEAATKKAYSCTSTTEMGASMMLKEGWDGCTGYSTSCSFQSKNIYWGAEKFHKKCGALQKCVPSWSETNEPKCENATDCQPEQDCCTATGDYEPQSTKCGISVANTKYQCSPNGQAIEVSKAYYGCTGSSTMCSSMTWNYHWTPWTTHKTCTSPKTCEASWTDSIAGKCVDPT